TPRAYVLPLHDALPIWRGHGVVFRGVRGAEPFRAGSGGCAPQKERTGEAGPGVCCWRVGLGRGVAPPVVGSWLQGLGSWCAGWGTGWCFGGSGGRSPSGWGLGFALPEKAVRRVGLRVRGLVVAGVGELVRRMG